MEIIIPDKHTFSLIRDFLVPYEEKCVLLCSYVRKDDDKIFVIVENKTNSSGNSLKGHFITKDGSPLSSKATEKNTNSFQSRQKILGVLRIDTTLFHYIPKENISKVTENAQQLLDAITKIIPLSKIHCISGEAAGTDFLINLLKLGGREPFQVNNYRLMIMKQILGSAAPAPLSNDDEIVRFTMNNIDELLPVQKRYLQDEVAPQGKKVSDLESKMSLRQILKNQLCLVIVSGGEIAAKANTNAIGIKWIQIGGVYTNPLFRRNGYAYQLVYKICVRALKVHKNIALFVKEKNQPAQKLYKKLGFLENGNYKIGYF